MLQIEKYYRLLVLVLLCTGTLLISTTKLIDRCVSMKWYAFVFCSILASVSLMPVLLSKKRTIVTCHGSNSLLGSIFILILYLITRSCVYGFTVHLAYLSGFLILLLFFYRQTATFNTVILTVCFIEAAAGLLQWLTIIPNHTFFPIVGSFDNPAGLASCLVAVFPLCFAMTPQEVIRKAGLLITASVISLAVILSGSRAGMLSILCATVFFFLYRFPGWKKKKIQVFSLIGLLMIGTCIALFSYKKDSSEGRLLIWSSSIELIKEHPAIGSGHNSFLSNYMPAQADYLAKKSNSRYELLADNVAHPLNEYLLLTIEYGLTGLALLGICLYFLFKHSIGELIPYTLCLLSIAIFALFSYPLRYPFVTVIIAYSVAQLLKKEKLPIKIKKKNRPFISGGSIVLISACILINAYLLIKDSRFEYKWKWISDLSLNGKTKDVLNDYEKLLMNWNGDPYFLYNYTAVLNHIGDYPLSISVGEKCTHYLNDYDVTMILADNCLNMKLNEKTEILCKRMISMCPNRFIPLSMLMEVYQRTGQKEKLNAIARDIMHKPVKILSLRILRIRWKARAILSNKIRGEPKNRRLM